MRAACERAVLALYELTEYVRLQRTDLDAVVVVGGSCLRPVLKRAVAMPKLRLCEDQPALRLREDTCIFLDTLVEADHQSAVKCVFLVRGVHYHRTVRRVELALDGIHCLLLLVLRAEVGDDRPGLRIEPHRSLGISALADDLSVLLVAADPAVFVPAILEDLFHLRVHAVEISDVIGIVLDDRVFAQNLHRVHELERNERGLTLLAETHTVIPVCVQTCRHSVVAEVVHRKIDRALQVVVHRALLHIVRVVDLLVEETDVAALGNVLVYGGEQPQRIVRAVARMSGLLHVGSVVRRVLVTRVVGVFYERKTCAVGNLRGEHEADLVRRHLRREVNDTLDILHGVAVTETVAEAAVLEGCRAGPGKCDEAVVRVPYVHHVVERVVRRMNLQIVKLCVPVCLQLFDFLLDNAVRLVARDDRLGRCLRLLTEKVRESCRLAGLKHNVALQRAAGVVAVVEVTLQTFRHTNRVCIASVVADKFVAVAAVCVNLRSGKA